ncbi:unnamed protein product [Cuscuta epithymum]|uniref:CCHC-type domain-containing protein n=1 Tax=Cuscuta epithymum TaxID=186058 RepID=A0AAV0DFE3_9ASTE|nr:unnamed protein product [Cuscuta epithymum]
MGGGSILKRMDSEWVAPGGTGHANREESLVPRGQDTLGAQIVGDCQVETKDESPFQGETEPLEASSEESNDYDDDGFGNKSIEQMDMIIDLLQRERVRLLQKRQARQEKGGPMGRKRMRGDNDSQWHSKRRNSEGDKTFEGPAPPPKWNNSFKGQEVRPQGSRVRKCDNCNKYHFGECLEPRRCYLCKDNGHIKFHCPQRIHGRVMEKKNYVEKNYEFPKGYPYWEVGHMKVTCPQLGQNSGSRASAKPRCRNCKKNHMGRCWDPPKCYQCGEVGHMKVACPQLGRKQATRVDGGTSGGKSQTRTSHPSTGDGGVMKGKSSFVIEGETQDSVNPIASVDAREETQPY